MRKPVLTLALSGLIAIVPAAAAGADCGYNPPPTGPVSGPVDRGTSSVEPTVRLATFAVPPGAHAVVDQATAPVYTEVGDVQWLNCAIFEMTGL